MRSQIPSSLARGKYEVRPLDIAAGALAPAIALFIRDLQIVGRADWQTLALYSVIAGGMTAVFGPYFRVGRILARYMSRHDAFTILKTCATVSAATAVVAFSLTRLDTIPRSLPLLHFMVAAGMMIGARLLAAEYFKRRYPGPAAPAGEAERKIIIVGATPMASLYIRLLGLLGGRQPRILCLLDGNKRLHGRMMDGYVVAGGLSKAPALIAEYATHGVFVDTIMIAYPTPALVQRAKERLEPLCAERGIRLDILSERIGFPISEAADVGAPAEEPAVEAPALGYLRLRRVVEIALSAAAIVALVPVWFVLIVLVAIDVGAPTIFWQERVGRGGRGVLVHKFRTLRNPIGADGRILPDELRLSWFGRLMRRVRLDELPQLFDVLRGDMAVIGPRPLLPVDMPAGESIRSSVRPGLTGWAQVHGGKAVSAEEKNALDEWYICHACLALDLKILALTARLMVKGDVRSDAAIAEALAFRRERVGAVKGRRREDAALQKLPSAVAAE